jgi:SdrD B-like domain/GEVED domain/SprB repeat
LLKYYVGPDSYQNIGFEWASYQGGNLGALTPTNNSPTAFKYKNISGVNQLNKYLLRMTRGNTCISYDTLQVTVFPEINDSATVSACKAATFSLAGTTGGTNYTWTPTNNLSSSTIPNPTVTGLTVNTKYVLTFTDANGCAASYKSDIKLTECANTALGDTIWWDKNYDGLQDVGEPGVAGITVVLVNPSNPTVAISSATTNAAGYFIFDKIPAGDYQIKFILPATMTFTKANQGTNDAKDSDADIVTGLTHSKYVSNGNRDFTFDAGIIYVDYGDLPDGATGTSTANYNTNLNDNGANHVIIDGLSIGNIVDGEQNGQPSSTAFGDDNAGTSDDEDGIGITNGITTWTIGKVVNLPIAVNNSTGQTAYLKGYIDWNNDGDFLDAGELILNLDGTTFPNSINITVPNSAAVNQLLGVRFRLSLDATMTSVGRVASGEVEDYVVKIICPTITTPSTEQTICAGTAGTNITVETNINTANSIKFVNFTSDQTFINGSETLTELASIYAGSVLATVTPTGASNPYTATYIFNPSDFPNTGTTTVTYYLYAILSDDNNGMCRPVQEIKVTVNPLPAFSINSTNVTCYGNADATITLTTSSGIAPFSYSLDDGVTFPNTTGFFNNLDVNTYKPAVKDANGCVKKCQ